MCREERMDSAAAAAVCGAERVSSRQELARHSIVGQLGFEAEDDSDCGMQLRSQAVAGTAAGWLPAALVDVWLSGDRNDRSCNDSGGDFADGLTSFALLHNAGSEEMAELEIGSHHPRCSRQLSCRNGNN